MDVMYSIFYFVFGITLGSFYNVVGLRVPLKQSIIQPPSHCFSCQHKLKAIDLIPVFSYFFIKGKCRKCQSRISPIYPLFELITGLLFVHSYITFGHTPEIIVALLFGSLLLIVSVSDVAYMVIPNKILLPLGIVIVILRIFIPTTPWWSSAAGAIIGFSMLLLLAILSKGGMGGGDIKLYFVIGLVVGVVNTLLSLFLASVIGMIYGIFIVAKRKEKKRVPIPFGPAIAMGAWLAYIYGNQMMQWYIQLW